MTTKRLNELDLKDAGVKARLAGMDRAFGGLSFYHTTVLNAGGGVVNHTLAVARMYDTRQEEEAQQEPPGGSGDTLDEAAAKLMHVFAEWTTVGRTVNVLEHNSPTTRRYGVCRAADDDIRVVPLAIRVGPVHGFSRSPWEECERI